jgi:hypothetical protein
LTLVTARIPELPQHVDELALGDKVPLWISGEDKTRHINLSELRSFLISGGGSTITPVLSGGIMIYKVPDTPAGTDTVSIPSLAGKSFNLEINGIPYIPQQDPVIAEAEYEILAGGGFKLINGVELFGGEKCKLEIFGSVLPPVGTPGYGSSLIEGNLIVNTNYTLDVANDLKKLVQLRGTSTQITLTVPNVNDLPDHTIIVIEASINNSKQNRITGTGGQYFYFNNISKTSIYINPGEQVWLYRGDDGLYVINDFGNHYRTLGDPYASYIVKDNTLLCKGQELLRSDYPRLWEYVQTLGSSLVSEATWSTAEVYHKDGVFYTTAPAEPYKTIPFPYRGCYSTGDGSTTFRIPDLMNMFLRGLKTEFGSDTERYLNKSGMLQMHELESHIHTGKMGEGTGPLSVPDNVTPNPLNSGSREYETDATGGVETRPVNIGVYWLINY